MDSDCRSKFLFRPFCGRAGCAEAAASADIVDVLLVREEMNLLGGTMFALDGCKLPFNASKEWSGTIAEYFVSCPGLPNWGKEP